MTPPPSHDLKVATGSARIAGTATAVPPHTLEREQVKTYIQKVFDLNGRRLESILAVIDHAQIDKRHAIFPVDYIIEPRSVTTKSAEYQEHALHLGRQAAEQCLAAAGMAAIDIDLIITVSCTGFMIPSLDAYLINAMGFRSDVRRLPV